VIKKVIFENISIKNKIYVFNVLILLVSLSILAFFADKISRQAIESKARKNSIRELALIENNIENLTRSIEDYIRILSMDYRLQQQLILNRDTNKNLISNLDSDKVLSKVISNMVNPATKISAASIMGYDQAISEVGYVDNSCIYSKFDKSIIQYIKDKKTPVWTSLFKLKYKFGGDENVFGIAKNITDFDTGENLGIAIMYLKEEEIASVYLDNMANRNDKFYIVDNDGKIISAQNKKDLNEKFRDIIELGKLDLNSFSNNEGMITSIEGKQSLVTVKDFNKLAWKIISIVPLEEITIENKQITKILLIIAMLCLVFAFAASYLVSYTITRPILKLVSIMRKVKLGKMDLRVEFNSNDEIGMLGEGFNNLMEKVQELMKEIYNEQKWKREYEFKLLQSQIKPHFLYNTLETIISFIKLDMKENAVKTTKSLAGFYRTSLSKGNDIITISNEVDLNSNYLSIQKLRYTEYLDYKLEFDEEILKYSIPKLTLQPLIENSIYHGLKQKEEKGHLIIKGYKEDNKIKIEVIDDGVGISKDRIYSLLNPSNEVDKSIDFGISSINSRLKLLYGEKYGLEIESELGEYTKIIVNLPANII
jgi:two-component system sensor histidine kinase YesM